MLPLYFLLKFPLFITNFCKNMNFVTRRFAFAQIFHLKKSYFLKNIEYSKKHNFYNYH